MWRIAARTLSTSHLIVHWMLGKLFTAQLSHKHTTVIFVFWMIPIFGCCISSKLLFRFVFKFVQVLWFSVLLTITPRLNRNIFIFLISHKRKIKQNPNINNNNNNGSKTNIFMHFKYSFFDWSFWFFFFVTIPFFFKKNNFQQLLIYFCRQISCKSWKKYIALWSLVYWILFIFHLLGNRCAPSCLQEWLEENSCVFKVASSSYFEI